MAANVDYQNAREHLLAKVVPDEEPPADSKSKMLTMKLACGSCAAVSTTCSAVAAVHRGRL